MSPEEELTSLVRTLIEIVRKDLPTAPPAQPPGRTLQKYNVELGQFLKFPAKNRQTYTDVLSQIYPLPADIGALTRFCNDFLNYGSSDPWTFEPAAPWVIMEVVNYGKMAMQSQNYGWVSQHELAFGFPVAWYETGANGQRKFIDWALVYPYIYVDDPLSMSLGRQVYGWAKAGIELMPPRPSLQPNTQCLVSIDLKGGPGGSGVDGLTKPRFLEILQHQPVMSGRSGLATLYSLPARAMGLYLSAASGMLGTLNSMVNGYEGRLSSYTSTAQALRGLITESLNLTGQTRQWYDSLTALLSNAQNLTLAQERVSGMPIGSQNIEKILSATDSKLRIITRKQFRDAADSEQACYSAIVASTMGYGQPIDGAPFISDPLSPEPDGGIQIQLRDVRADAKTMDEKRKDDEDVGIVRSLGLKTSNREDDGRWSVYTLRPVAPFWLKLNATYGSADRQVWRTRNTNWAIDSNPGAPSGGGVTPVQTRPSVKPDSGLPAIPYNLYGSDAFQEVPGPMKSANFGLWIYALEADEKTLVKLCKNYLRHKDENGDPIYEFKVSPPQKDMAEGIKEGHFYVLMIVSSFDAMCGIGDTPEFKNLKDRLLTFAIPARCWRKGKATKWADREPEGGTDRDSEEKGMPILIPLYTFVEQDWDFLTEYEVYGRFAFKSVLESPPDTWVEKSKAKQELLSVHTSVFAEGGSNPERARFKPLVQIWVPPDDELPQAEDEDTDGEDTDAERAEAELMDREHMKVPESMAFRQDLNFAKNYLAWLGLDDTSPGLIAKSIHSVSLKQIRDALEADRASYQSIVGVKRTIEGDCGKAHPHRRLEVRFYNYPGLTIWETLGIINGKKINEMGEEIKDQVKGQYQYYRANTVVGTRIHGKMAEENAVNMCWTVEEDKWQDNWPGARPFFS